MSTTKAPTGPIRYVELDSLRGLAALAVVAQHLQELWEGDVHPASTDLRFFLELTRPFGSEAVILFFVLSGFVLSLPAVAGKPQSYLTFVTRRVFRIYVPYLPALAVSVAGALWLHSSTINNDFLEYCWLQPVSWRAIGQHVMFLGVHNTLEFDPPIWSLIYEMRISLIFPLLCGLVLRFKSGWSLAIATGLTLLAIVIGQQPFNMKPTVCDSLHYAGLFVLGTLLAREKSSLGAWYQNRQRPARILLGVVSLLLFLFVGSQLARQGGATVGSWLYYLSQWPTALGAGGLMIVSMNSASFKRVLLWRPIHFLGQISYSLYLWHFIVLLYCAHLLYGRFSLAAIMCLVFFLSILVSWFSYRWIEVPSIRLGRRLSNVFQRPPPRDSHHTQIPAIPE